MDNTSTTLANEIKQDESHNDQCRKAMEKVDKVVGERPLSLSEMVMYLYNKEKAREQNQAAPATPEKEVKKQRTAPKEKHYFDVVQFPSTSTAMLQKLRNAFNKQHNSPDLTKTETLVLAACFDKFAHGVFAVRELQGNGCAMSHDIISDHICELKKAGIIEAAIRPETKKSVQKARWCRISGPAIGTIITVQRG